MWNLWMALFVSPLSGLLAFGVIIAVVLFTFGGKK